jgi:hypothetical protein
LGDWITYNTFAQFDGQQLFLKKYWNKMTQRVCHTSHFTLN